MVSRGRQGRACGDETAGKDGIGLCPDVIDPENREGVQTGMKKGKEDKSRKKVWML